MCEGQLFVFPLHCFLSPSDVPKPVQWPRHLWADDDRHAGAWTGPRHRRSVHQLGRQRHIRLQLRLWICRARLLTGYVRVWHRAAIASRRRAVCDQACAFSFGHRCVLSALCNFGDSGRTSNQYAYALTAYFGVSIGTVTSGTLRLLFNGHRSAAFTAVPTMVGRLHVL